MNCQWKYIKIKYCIIFLFITKFHAEIISKTNSYKKFSNSVKYVYDIVIK